MNESKAALSLKGLGHTFVGPPLVKALENINLEIERGLFVSLVGPSGCGKSTLLRILAGITEPDLGTAQIHGENAIGSTGQSAYMAQKDLLLPWKRVLQNATLGAELSGIEKTTAKEMALALINQFGLTNFEKAWPSQLSGGMRQRLALLRTFLMPQQLLLLDEPFGALDAITRRAMQEWLQEVWEKDQRTVLLVTHDVEEALILSDIVYVMKPRPGSIVFKLNVEYPRPRKNNIVTSMDFVKAKALLLEILGDNKS